VNLPKRTLQRDLKELVKKDQAFSALANLADMAGQVSVTVKAENPAGFDKSKLNNGVLEPLRDTEGLRSFIEKAVNNAPFGLLITQGESPGVVDPRVVALPLSSLMLLR
jgi:hypothetical protein